MNPAKVGADDFTAAGLGEAELGGLPREDLPTTLEPTVTAMGDDLCFAWPSLTVEARLSHQRDSGEGLYAELAVQLGGTEIHWARLNVASTTAREGVVRKLLQVDRGIPWRALLEHTCRLGAQAARTGEPIVTLQPSRQAPETRYLIPRLVLRGETTVIHADGGSGKSLLALALGVVAGAAVELPAGLHAGAAVRVLYLDYESCREEHEDRLASLMAGWGLLDPPAILYRRMVRPLTDDAALLRAEISRHQVGLVIVDSLAPACGAEPEGSDAAIRTMNVLRSFGSTSRLVLAHVSKAGAEQRSGATRPFGSVFVQNLARSVWELRRGGETTEDLVMALYHRKTNAGRLYAPFALRFRFTPEAVTIQSGDLTQEPDLALRTSVRYRLEAALLTGQRTTEALMDATGASKDTVARTLRRLRADGRVTLVGPDSWGLTA